ncbi:MAG: hypothetical protein K1X53_05885 [Candidatus Sumerlaeaceae bacterium]|nr:hypothetical protein [Candidatus Sumerlaeaceae bacterium]
MSEQDKRTLRQIEKGASPIGGTQTGGGGEKRTCPLCGGTILPRASKCTFCGTFVSGAEASVVETPIPDDGASSSAAQDTRGTALVVVPAAATIVLWVWIFRVSALEHPMLKLMVVLFLNSLFTGLVAAGEARKLKMGLLKEPRTRFDFQAPIWFVILLFAWFVGYPLYHLARAGHGLGRFLKAGLVIAGIFCVSFLVNMALIFHHESQILADLKRREAELLSKPLSDFIVEPPAPAPTPVPQP